MMGGTQAFDGGMEGDHRQAQGGAAQSIHDPKRGGGISGITFGEGTKGMDFDSAQNQRKLRAKNRADGARINRLPDALS